MTDPRELARQLRSNCAPSFNDCRDAADALDALAAGRDRLRAAIRAHNPEVTEAAWEKCERWLEALPLPAPPAD